MRATNPAGPTSRLSGRSDELGRSLISRAAEVATELQGTNTHLTKEGVA